MSSYHSSKSHHGTCTSGEYKVTEKFVCWFRVFCELVMLLGSIDLFTLYILIPHSGHVIFSREFVLCLVINYAYKIMHMHSGRHLKETVLRGNITWSEMGEQSIQAKKVYREEKLLHHVAMVANYLRYSLDDNHTVNLYFQSTISMHVFPAAVSIKCSVGKDTMWFSF